MSGARPAAVLLALLFLAATVPLASGSIAAPPGHGEPRKIDYTHGPVQAMFFNEPSQHAKGYSDLALLRGTTTHLWMRLSTQAWVNDTVTMTATEGASITENATFDVSLEPGVAQWFRLGVQVPAELENDTRWVEVGGKLANLTGDGDTSVGFSASFHAIAPVSVTLRTDPMFKEVVQPGMEDHPNGKRRVLKVGHETPVRFVMDATNHGSTATSHTILLFAQHDRKLAEVTVDLDAGETKAVDLHTFVLGDDLPEYSSDFGAGSTYTYVNFALAALPEGDTYDATDGRGWNLISERPAYTFSFDNGTLTNLRYYSDALEGQFYFGVLAAVTDTHLAHGETSWVVVDVTNYGSETARGLRVDVSAWPEPAAYYGAGTYIRESRRVTLGAGESTSLNITFVPHVASTYNVKAQAYVGTGSFERAEPVRLPTPVSFNITGDMVMLGGMGDSLRATVGVNSSINLTGARLGLAVTTLDWWQEGVPFAQFVTGADIMDVQVPDASFDLIDNGVVWQNVTFTPRTAGNWALIPFIKVGDLVYTGNPVASSSTGPDMGGGDGRFEMPMPHRGGGTSVAHIEVRVLSGEISLPLLWAPVGLVVAVFVGYWVYRQKGVR